MKVGIIADVHGYEEPLELVLQAVSREGAKPVMCLGDIMSGGQAVDQCIRLLKTCATCVRGNHDNTDGSSSAGTKDYLKNVPLDVTWRFDDAPRDAYFFVHDNPLPRGKRHLGLPPFEDDAGIKTDAQADVVLRDLYLREMAYRAVFVGHTHRPAAWVFRNRRTERLDVPLAELEAGRPFVIPLEDHAMYLINPGAVAEPKVFTPHAVANPREEKTASYGILDTVERTFTLRSIPMFRGGKPLFDVKPANRRDYI